MPILCVNVEANLMKISSNSRAMEFTFIAVTYHILRRAKHNTKCKLKFFQATLTFTLSDLARSKGFLCVKVLVLQNLEN
jgi:hypothetical protein